MSLRKTLLAGIGCITLISVMATILAWHLFSGNSEGIIHEGTPIASTDTVQPLPLKNPLFTTLMPTGFTVKQQLYMPRDDPELQVEANTPSSSDQQITISAGPLPGSGIQGLGDYTLRSTQTNSYVPFLPPALPTGAVAYRRLTAPAEFTVFWAHEHKYYEISLSAGSTASLTQLDSAFAQLIISWQWQ